MSSILGDQAKAAWAAERRREREESEAREAAYLAEMAERDKATPRVCGEVLRGMGLDIFGLELIQGFRDSGTFASPYIVKAVIDDLVFWLKPPTPKYDGWQVGLCCRIQDGTVNGRWKPCEQFRDLAGLGCVIERHEQAGDLLYDRDEVDA